MSDPRLNFLFARRPAIEYVSPAVCEVVFSSSGFPSIIFPEFHGLSAITGFVWSKVAGNFRLSWTTIPDVLCYTVYESDTNDPNGPYHVVATCDPTQPDKNYYDVTTDPTNKHFKVTAITTEGVTPDSTPHAGPGGNPGDPTPFGNQPQSVEEPCPFGGGTFFYTVPADTFTSWSQFDADTLAFAAASGMALANQICLDDILPDACTGDSYHAEITASGGDPDTWLVPFGGLPPGLSLVPDLLDPTKAALDGSPTTGGTYVFTVRCSDPNGNYVQRDYEVSVMEITNENPLPDGEGDVGYSVQLTQVGGTEPLTWGIIAGSLPPGLSLDSGTGIIDGTPAAGGDHNFTVEVTDDNGLTCSKEFDLHVEASSQITFSAGAEICGAGSVNYQASMGPAGSFVAADCSSMWYTTPITTTIQIGQNYTVKLDIASPPDKFFGVALVVSDYDPLLKVIIDGLEVDAKTYFFVPLPRPASHTFTFSLQYL